MAFSFPATVLFMVFWGLVFNGEFEIPKFKIRLGRRIKTGQSVVRPNQYANHRSLHLNPYYQETILHFQVGLYVDWLVFLKLLISNIFSGACTYFLYKRLVEKLSSDRFLLRNYTIRTTYYMYTIFPMILHIPRCSRTLSPAKDTGPSPDVESLLAIYYFQHSGFSLRVPYKNQCTLLYFRIT